MAPSGKKINNLKPCQKNESILKKLHNLQLNDTAIKNSSFNGFQ